ncbi:DUF4303 domain-containing protein [Steroidobacter flavus]|uniref:DUF4303 domain-containing protein n=1 Tax=Steroidobacter flavus TaxID=1842136 RepID=A0ABV8SZ63_9GAMM
MTTHTEPTVTIERICAALRTAAETQLREISRIQPRETLYAFLFECTKDGFAVLGAIGTQEQLTRYALEQLEKLKPLETLDPVAAVRSAFRWGSPQDGWYRAAWPFDEVNDLLREAERTQLYETFDGTLQKLCIETLQAMDRDGIFGTGVRRERIAIGVCITGGDTSDPEFMTRAERLNPHSVVERLRAEVDLTHRDMNLLEYLPLSERGLRTNQEMSLAAEGAVGLALGRFDVTLDYSEASLGHADALIERVRRTLSDNDPEIDAIIFDLGAYVGEVMKRHIGGTWSIHSKEHPFRELRTFQAGARGVETWPHSAVEQQLRGRQSTTLDAYFRKIKAAAE